MLFDWLITGQGVSMNPAAAVRGPKHVVNEGKMPVLGGPEWGGRLIDSIPTAPVSPPSPTASRVLMPRSNARQSREPKGSSWLIRLHETGCPRCGIGAGDLDSGGTLSSEKAKPRSPTSAAGVEAE